MNNKELLEKIGLNKGEAEIYNILLENGEKKPRELLKLTENLTRTNIYKILNSLASKGLAEKKEKGKVLFFAPLDPYRLLSVLDQRKKSISEAQTMLSSVLPLMLESFKETTEKPLVRVYQGFEGIKKVYNDTLQTREPILSYLGLYDSHPEALLWLKKYYVRERIKKKISAKVIVSVPKEMDKETADYLKRNDNEMRQTKIVSNTSYPAKMEIQVYGDKVSFANHNKSDAMIGVIIESKIIADTVRGMLSALWDRAE